MLFAFHLLLTLKDHFLFLTQNLPSVSFVPWNRNALNLYWAFFTGAGQHWYWELKNFVDLKVSNTLLHFWTWKGCVLWALAAWGCWGSTPVKYIQYQVFHLIHLFHVYQQKTTYRNFKIWSSFSISCKMKLLIQLVLLEQLRDFLSVIGYLQLSA